MTKPTNPRRNHLRHAALVLALAYASAGAASCVQPRRPGVDYLAENERLRLEIDRLRAAQAENEARAREADEWAQRRVREAEDRAAERLAARDREQAERIEAERERIQQDLVEEIRRGNLSVLGTAEGVSISVAEAVLFDLGSIEIRPEARRTLDEVAKVLGREADRPVRVVGHTDDVRVRPNPAFDDNWDLSGRRAASVARYLISKGVPADRMRIEGYADRRPVVPNTSAEHRQKNRRVEIVLGVL